MSGEVDVIFLDHRCISHKWDSWNRRELGSSGSASLMNLGNVSKDPLHLLKSQHGIIVLCVYSPTKQPQKAPGSSITLESVK